MQEITTQAKSIVISKQSDDFSQLPKTKEQCLFKGINYYNAKRYKESLEACERAIQLDTHYARAYHGKGLSLAGLERYKKAIVSLNKAIQFTQIQQHVSLGCMSLKAMFL